MHEHDDDDGEDARRNEEALIILFRPLMKTISALMPRSAARRLAISFRAAAVAGARIRPIASVTEAVPSGSALSCCLPIGRYPARSEVRVEASESDVARIVALIRRHAGDDVRIVVR